MVVEYKIPKVRMRARTAEQTALDVAFRKRMSKLRRKGKEKLEDDPDSGVVFLSNLPHAFCEYAIFKYFSQFGRIKRVRLSRSKKSARSKGFAYVEFEYAEVAKIAADTMNNYLMFRKLIKCKVVPKEELHEDTFKGCFRRFGQPRGRMNSIKRNNRYAAVEDTKRIAKNLARRTRKENKKEKLLKEMGIDFDIDGYGTQWKAVKATFSDARKARQISKDESVDRGDEKGTADSVESDSNANKVDAEEERLPKDAEEPTSSDVGRKSLTKRKISGKEDTAESSDRLEKDSAEDDGKEASESPTEDVVKRPRRSKRTQSGRGAPAVDKKTPSKARRAPTSRQKVRENADAGQESSEGGQESTTGGRESTAGGEAAESAPGKTSKRTKTPMRRKRTPKK